MHRFAEDMLRIAAENAADLHPDWFETERRLFVEVKDLDKDSRLSRDEVMQWLVPSNYDRFKAEAHRLIHQADLNQVYPQEWKSL